MPIVRDSHVVPSTAPPGNIRIRRTLRDDETNSPSVCIAVGFALYLLAFVLMYNHIRNAAILVTATGGSYFATQTDWGHDAINDVTQVVSGYNAEPSSENGYAGHALYEIETLRNSNPNQYRYDAVMAAKLQGRTDDSGVAPSLVGGKVNDLRDVMRFDITPNWVLQRFSRVTTVLADTRLEGMRVPIVTGTKPDDIAGTLSYYFDGNGSLQRVTLHGFTGDPQRLVSVMKTHYEMNREPSLEAGVFTKRWNGEPVHFLRMTHAPIVYSDAIHQKYTLFLELNQPNLAYGISRQAELIIQADKGSGRW